jgi:hypothetical protein
MPQAKAFSGDRLQLQLATLRQGLIYAGETIAENNSESRPGARMALTVIRDFLSANVDGKRSLVAVDHLLDALGGLDRGRVAPVVAPKGSAAKKNGAIKSSRRAARR